MNTFGQSAIKTFATMLSGLTNNAVRIEVRGRQAHTDGTTVVLPAEGVWPEHSFRDLCGVAVHEVGHVWFGSNAFQQRVLAPVPDDRKLRVAMAINVVLDVADETRFECLMPAAEELLRGANESALREAQAAGQVMSPPPAEVPMPLWLAAGIWLVRSKPRSVVRRAFRSWQTRVPGLKDVVKLLNRVVERPNSCSASPVRDDRGWQRLERAVADLVGQMEKWYPPNTNSSTAPAQPQPDDHRRWWGRLATTTDEPGAVSTPAPTQADWRTILVAQPPAEPESAPPLEPPAGPLGSAEMLDAEDDLDDLDDDGDDDDWDDWDLDVLKQMQDQFDAMWEEFAEAFTFDHACCQRLVPEFRQATRMLAAAPTVDWESKQRCGNRLAEPHRAYLDGRCFRRRITVEGTDTAVALLFDHSASMSVCLHQVLPVGVALATALEAMPGVKLAIYRFGSEVERLSNPRDLQTPKLLGTTATDEALAAARSWLKGLTVEQRVVVLLTDGDPDDPRKTAAELQQLQRMDVQLLAGAIGMACDACARRLPGMTVFSVDPADAVASLHTAMLLLRRRLRA